MTRLIALDVGAARIGVAVSDSMRFLASPYTTLYVDRGNEAKLWAEIQRCIDETEAGGLVIGLPISLDGQIHAQGERVQAFAERLKQHIDIPITFWDERLSTVEAERLIVGGEAELGKRYKTTGGRKRSQTKRRRKKQEIDALAATVILQEYLDAQMSKTRGTEQ